MTARGRAREAIVSHRASGVAQRDDLRMRRRIDQADGPVEPRPDNAALDRDDGADRHLAGRERAPGFVERRSHQALEDRRR